MVDSGVLAVNGIGDNAGRGGGSGVEDCEGSGVSSACS